MDFERLLDHPEYAAAVRVLGFVSSAKKEKALRDADVFCFPTHYLGENQPVNLIEAMAFGLPIVTTRWRSLPEMFPAGYPGLISGQAPNEIADKLLFLASHEASGKSPRKLSRAVQLAKPSDKTGPCNQKRGKPRAGVCFAAGLAKFLTPAKSLRKSSRQLS
ncbi:MAG: glycosyltransferase [Limisphaerales bacterium]